MFRRGAGGFAEAGWYSEESDSFRVFRVFRGLLFSTCLRSAGLRSSNLNPKPKHEAHEKKNSRKEDIHIWTGAGPSAAFKNQILSELPPRHLKRVPPLLNTEEELGSTRR